MGQCISVPHRKLSLMREDSLRRFYKSRNGHLSATFHVLDTNLRWDLLNVNIATEEQLMTLPGITRVIAQNIVEYRQTIGGFKKVEDLALVSGVGAVKLEQFRNEICVGRRKGPGGSYNSSLDQSLESLQNNDNCTRSSPLKLVSVNTANVFQLMTVRGMTQEMAANILHHRERKGPFKTIDDLLKVKGLPPDRLATVRLYLTVDSSPVYNGNVSQNKVATNNLSNKPVSNRHRRTSSAPCRLGKPACADTLTKEFYEIVSSQIPRPIVKDVFTFSKGNRPALRIGTWNLQKFVIDKARNPGVREVVCRTILENGLSLVAVQEIASREALSTIASELNEPQLPGVQNWNGHFGKWQSLLPPPTTTTCDSTHRKAFSNGFLYDTSHGLQLRDSTVLYLPQDKQRGLTAPCQPFLGWFRVESMDFVVVTFSLINEGFVSQLLPPIMDLLREHIPEEKNVFLLGDFALPPDHAVFEIMKRVGFSHLLSARSLSNLSAQHQSSHIWASRDAAKIFTGSCGVVSQGLSHLAIPKGWQWGGTVSDHYPVWSEMYTEHAPCAASTPMMNGIRKVSTILEDTDSEITTCDENCNSSEIKTKPGKFWRSTWKWNNSHKDTSRKQNKECVEENGAT